MRTINVHENLLETYLRLLGTLSINDKLELISKLSQSMKMEKSKEVPFQELFGAFQSEKTAEKQIEEIRQARNFNRQNFEF